MSSERRGGRRAFRPTIEGERLETRALMAQLHFVPFHRANVMVANGGRDAVVTDVDGEQYRITATNDGFLGIGPTVRARPAPGGRVDLIVYGSTADSELEINPIPHPTRIRGQAHQFPHGSTIHDGLLHVRSINVTSGRIGQILAYRTADLSGPILVSDTTPVDRIAFSDLLPGASIITGGDLNTFNVLNNLTLGGGPGISIGRDLNWLNVGGTVTLQDGSSFVVVRDIGLNNQPPKGTDPGGQGGLIQGDFLIGPDSTFVVGRALDDLLGTFGTVVGTSRVSIPFGFNNLVALGGLIPEPADV